jgi:hypothetical protein
LQSDSSMQWVWIADSITAKRPGNCGVWLNLHSHPCLPPVCLHPLHREQRSLAGMDHYILPHRHLVLSPSTLHHHPPPLPTGCCSCACNRPLSTCQVPPPSALKRLPAPKGQWRLIRDLFKFNLISSSPSLQERHRHQHRHRRRYLRDLCPYFRT